MGVVKHLSDSTLEKSMISRLGILYMNAFNLNEFDLRNKPEIYRIEQAMKKRSLDDRIEVLRLMESQKAFEIQAQEYEHVKVTEKMIKQFYNNVLLD